MKKIFVIIILALMLTGCYDNIELNELAIITGLGIDYYDDEIYLTYEILNDTKTEENTTMKSYTVTGHGKTIAEAFTNANYKVGKNPYFAHLKVTLLSENIINGHFEEICDYLIRDTNIRDEFITLVAHSYSPEEILSHNSDNNPVVSDTIMNLIDNEKFNNNLAVDEIYQNTVSKAMSDFYDIILNSITIIDDKIAIHNSYIFNGYKAKNILSKRNSSLYNLLTKNVHSLEFDHEYEKGNVTISITNSKTGINVTNDTIDINLNLEGKILENNAKFDLKEEKSYQKLNKEFEKVIQKEVRDFIKVLQKNKSDIIGFQDIYYKSTRKKNKKLWINSEINVSVKLNINTKGFVFEVKN